MALVDVELFVSSGAPRTAFSERLTDVGSVPMFDLDLGVLRAAGWVIDGTGMRPPEGSSASVSPPPHPYALGPKWIGENCWRADFGHGLTGIVDHDWCDAVVATGLGVASGVPVDDESEHPPMMITSIVRMTRAEHLRTRTECPNRAPLSSGLTAALGGAVSRARPVVRRSS